MYLGGEGALGHGPPFWVARIAKLKHAPPLQVGHQSLSLKSPGIWVKDEMIGQKMGRDLSEDLFCFVALHLFLGKYGTNFE